MKPHGARLSIGLVLAVVLAFAYTGNAFAVDGLSISGLTQLDFGVMSLANFELDGNAIYNGMVGADDWDLLYNGTGHQQVWTGILPSAPTPGGLNARYTQGSSDLQDFSTLRWDDGTPPDKADITNAYAALYTGNHFYFGADRYATNGTTYIGFWLLKGEVGVNPGGTFSGNHVVGDILILSDFTGGGGVATIGVYRWDGVGVLTPLAVDPNSAFAIVNAVAAVSPWPYTPKSGSAGTFPVGGFFEGGADLGALGITGCFSNFLAETRSSNQLTAELKDFVLGSFRTIADVAVNSDTICVGDPAVQLCAQIAPGTGLPPFTYAWTGPGGYRSTDSCITVGGGFAAGTYTYTVVVTCSNGCVSDPASGTLTVLASPTCSIDGLSTVCPLSTNPHCGPVGMASYQWSISGNGSIPGPTNGQCVQVQAGSN